MKRPLLSERKSSSRSQKEVRRVTKGGGRFFHPSVVWTIRVVAVAGTLFVWVVVRSQIDDHRKASSSSSWSLVNIPSSSPPFSILHLPELTDWLIGNFTEEAVHFYQDHALNEEQGELWLHRGFRRLLQENHPKKKEPWVSAARNEEGPTVIILCAYLHFNQYLYKKQQQRLSKRVSSEQTISSGPPYSTDAWMRILQDRVEDAIRTARSREERITFLLAVPTWNPTRGNEIGLSKLSRFFYRTVIPQQHDNRIIRYVSLGYERNVHWQKVRSPHDILPIPYVVSVNATPTVIKRIPNSVFYAGDTRPHAVRWSGCNRTALLQPLQEYYSSFSKNASSDHPETHPVVDVRLLARNAPRLSMDEYHQRMAQSHYCLIVCGDTPTSRSLSSALVHGCTPLFIGMERWYGYCEAPTCHAGWGWTVLHNETMTLASSQTMAAISHFPFASKIDYRSEFPSVKEPEWARNPVKALQTVLQKQSPPASFWSDKEKEEMWSSRFLYGSGNPVTTDDWGSAVASIWDSFVRTTMGRR